MTFGELTRLLLFEKENYGAIYQAIHGLHNFYAGVTGVAAGQTTDKNIMLPTGKAISPGHSAGCLLDIQRTVVFIRGVYKAILHLQQQFTGPIHILYAGCGPYATFLTPLTTMFPAKDVRFYLMDVNRESLQAVEKLYAHLQCSDVIGEIICTDATEYKLDKPMHLIVCEAMQPALSKEPQVSIMLNLIPQMMEKAVFVPEEVEVRACLLDRDRELDAKLNGKEPERVELGMVYAIGREDCVRPGIVVLDIPEDTNGCNELDLLTEVKVFGEERLRVNECAITLPLKVGNVVGGEKVELEYVIGKVPGFRVRSGAEVRG